MLEKVKGESSSVANMERRNAEKKEVKADMERREYSRWGSVGERSDEKGLENKGRRCGGESV